MCANPSYLHELAKTVSQQLQPPGKKLCSDLNSIYMWINVTECTEHKGIYQDNQVEGVKGGTSIEMTECILMEGQVWGGSGSLSRDHAN